MGFNGYANNPIKRGDCMKRLTVSLTDQEAKDIKNGNLSWKWVVWLLNYIVTHYDEIVE